LHTLSLVVEPGQISAKIMCTHNSVGFEFINVIDLHIESLTFSECGKAFSESTSNTRPHAAIRFKNVTNLSLRGITVTKSRGYGIYADQILGSSYIQDSTFMQNNASNKYQGGNAILFYRDCPSTGENNHHLHIESSKFLHGRNNITNGDLAAGLTLFMECTNVRITLNNVKFKGNEASAGGNFAIIYHNVIQNFAQPIVVNNSQIEDGRALFGGGMYATFYEEPEKKILFLREFFSWSHI